jgi:hypothetical protein
MPVYTFHLCSGATSRPIKTSRCEFPDRLSALAEANRIGFAMVRSRVGRKACQLRSRLDVRDESNLPVARLLLADLLQRIT